jgi:hypothetical protein
MLSLCTGKRCGEFLNLTLQQEQHFKRSADVAVTRRYDLVDNNLITCRELHNTPLHESRVQISPRHSGEIQRYLCGKFSGIAKPHAQRVGMGSQARGRLGEADDLGLRGMLDAAR